MSNDFVLSSLTKTFPCKSHKQIRLWDLIVSCLTYFIAGVKKSVLSGHTAFSARRDVTAKMVQSVIMWMERACVTLDLRGFIVKKECVQKGFMASNATRDVPAILPTLSGMYIVLYIY